MSFFKLLLLIAIFGIFTYYIFYTVHYYSFCTFARLKNNYLIEERKEIYAMLCESTFKDYSNHYIMRYSLDLVYSLISKTRFSPHDLEDLKSFLHKTTISKMKSELYILKTVHLGFYLLLLYFLVIKFPKIVIDIVLYFFDKLLIIIFLILVAEIILNMYLDIHFDLFKMLRLVYDYLPFDYFFRALKFL